MIGLATLRFSATDTKCGNQFVAGGYIVYITYKIATASVLETQER